VKNKKATRLIVSICLVLALVVPLLLTACGEPAPTGPIKIGVVHGKTSFLSYHGEVAEWGYRLAEEEINANGGVLGRPIELVWRASQCKPDVSLREAKSLVYDEKVDFLMGTLLTSGANAISAFSKEEQVLFMGMANGANAAIEDRHRYFFKATASAQMMSKAQAANIKEEGFKTVWFISPDYDYGYTQVDASKKYLAEEIPDAKVIGESWPALGEKDFGPYIAQIAQAKPDVIFSWIFGGDNAAFVTQAMGFGLFDEIQYAGDFSPESLRPLGLNVPEGLLGVSNYEPFVPDTPANKAFADKVMAKYGDYPTRETTTFYTAVYMLAQAIEEAGTTDTEAVIDALEKTRFNSPWGEVYYTSDHQVTVPCVIGKSKILPGKDYLGIIDNAIALPGDKLHDPTYSP